MRGRKHSEDVATEPYAARVDDANETKPSSRKKTFSANLCSQNWWRYTPSACSIFSDVLCKIAETAAFKSLDSHQTKGTLTKEKREEIRLIIKFLESLLRKF